MYVADCSDRGGPPSLRYRAPDGATWLHALHGSVPDHQIDFICSPDAPQGAFTRTHLGHLARLMKYIEPHAGSPFAFAIGNLSRDDTQHEPGHGAVALLFGMRIEGATDSAGRRDPPFAHAIIAVDRDLTYRAFLDAATALHRQIAGHAGRRTPAAFYHEYARAAVERPDAVSAVLQGYLDEFRDLPELRPSALSGDIAAGAEARPGRIFLVHSEDEPFGNLMRAAAKLAAVLYRSTVRWTAIVSGGAVHIPGGLSIELVTSLPLILGPDDRVLGLSELPEDEEAIARDILGAPPRARHGLRWRAPEAAAGAAADEEEPTRVRPLERDAPPRPPLDVDVGFDVDLGALAEPTDTSVTPRVAPGRDSSRASARAPSPWSTQAPRVNPPTPRPARRWLGVGVVGAGLALAAVTLLSARGGSAPPVEVAEAPLEGRVEVTPPTPSPVGAPVVVHIDEALEQPAKELAKAESRVPRRPAPRAEPVRARTAAPQEKAQEKAPRIFGGREPVWMKKADSGRR